MSELAWQANCHNSEKLVLLCLADRHNGETGQCFPSYTTIAKRCGLSRETVARALDGLERGGWIVTSKKNRCQTYYTLTLNWSEVLTSSKPETEPTASQNFRGDWSEVSTKLVRTSDCNRKEPEKNGNEKPPSSKLDSEIKQSDAFKALAARNAALAKGV